MRFAEWCAVGGGNKGMGGGKKEQSYGYPHPPPPIQSSSLQ